MSWQISDLYCINNLTIAVTQDTSFRQFDSLGTESSNPSVMYYSFQNCYTSSKMYPVIAFPHIQHQNNYDFVFFNVKMSMVVKLTI